MGCVRKTKDEMGMRGVERSAAGDEADEGSRG